MMETKKKSKTDESQISKKQRTTANENKDMMNESASKKFSTFPKSIQVDSLKNFGEIPLRTYELMRNQFVGM